MTDQKAPTVAPTKPVSAPKETAAAKPVVAKAPEVNQVGGAVVSEALTKPAVRVKPATAPQAKKEQLGYGHKTRFPTRLDILDMPQDVYNVTGGLRSLLCKQVNYCRQYPAKMAVLAQVLQYTMERMEQLHELNEEQVAKEVTQ